MATGRMRRGLASLALGGLGALVSAVLAAPAATAAPTTTVTIRDLTPPAASVDQGGSVTFINGIADKTLSVGVGPLAVTATVHTDVTLKLPSGSHQLAPGQSATGTFAQTATCTITYTYRAEGASLTQVLSLLPPLPAPTPFVVTTLPLPNLPSTNLPSPPPVQVLPPAAAPSPAPPAPAPSTGPTQGSVPGPAAGGPPSGTGVTGSPAPPDAPAATTFGPARSAAGAGRAGSSGGPLAGAGSRLAYDGASVPVLGRGGGENGTRTGVPSSGTPDAALTSGSRVQLPIAAVVAVVALAGVTAGLVRTHQLHRAAR